MNGKELLLTQIIRNYGERINAGKTAQSKWYYSDKAEKEAKNTEDPQKTYGSISRFFNPPATTGMKTPTLSSIHSSSRSPSPPRWIGPSSTSPSPPRQRLSPPSGWVPVVSTQSSSAPPIFLTPLVDFERTFFHLESFENEVQQLMIWLKKNKEKVTKDWLKRVNGVLDLLRRQGIFLYLSTDCAKERKTKWEEYNEAIAVRLEKGSKTLPPCPMQGHHVQPKSLYDDEGVILAVRAYLNSAMWRASLQIICDFVKAYLQSQKAYDVMQIDVVLHNNDWAAKTTQYREMIFCPRMKKIFKTLREYDDSGQVFKSFFLFLEEGRVRVVKTKVTGKNSWYLSFFAQLMAACLIGIQN
ncbi:hypothetical protein K440DRAFT_679919 [Wilcoxina mikolae CBS 423.85]|nr:hypothetical protein K440DRAFT_679919 [Wilcoxina mikolae CBS 423.85]